MTAAGLTPNTFTYSTLINACAKGAQLSKAFATLKEMSDEGLVPNVVTWTTLIDACSKVCCCTSTY
jgi:pentatricopeptide repeat domain-containing protein 1